MKLQTALQLSPARLLPVVLPCYTLLSVSDSFVPLFLNFTKRWHPLSSADLNPAYGFGSRRPPHFSGHDRNANMPIVELPFVNNPEVR